MIEFECPHCRHRTAVAPQYAGQTGPCAQCGQTVTIPALAGAPPAPSGGSSAGIWIGVGVAVIVGLLCVVGILAALLLPAIGAAREAARRTQCMNHLRQIGLAMHNYEATYGSFPPAATYDADGRPLHSWRTLILPFLEQKALYDQIRLEEPWDSPHNRQFHNTVIPIYRCPSSPDDSIFDTNYMVVVGEQALFPTDGEATTIADVTDGLSHTLMAAEVDGAGVHWMAPEDLPLDGMSLDINDGSGEGVGSWHPGGANVLMADGSVTFLADDVDPGVLRSMLTRDQND